MSFIADLHIHSHYSRATSRQMNIVSLAKWSQLKGTSVVGTGDFTHPEWLSELREKLEPAEPGLFRLKREYEHDIQKDIPESCRNSVRFMLTVEISSIYRKGGRGRRVHNLIFSPSFENVEKINKKLTGMGNLNSDGRPILGLDSKELLKIMLDVSDEQIFVPAHAWTPWFSVFGSQSGFDSLYEAFDELTPHIYAIETGLSSDPAMNWRLSALDSVALISNSDAHSPEKLGREANIFDTDLSYYAIVNAIKKNDKDAFSATIEFFPEEGKYHLDGHRNCNVRLTPDESKKHNLQCPTCGRSLTLGVLHRVETLSDRGVGAQPANPRPFHSIIPLTEIIGEAEQVGPSSKKVKEIYMKLLKNLGNEFSILLNASPEDIEQHSSVLVGEGVRRMRNGGVHIKGGYDGEYGTIKIFDDKDRERTQPQETLF